MTPTDTNEMTNETSEAKAGSAGGGVDRRQVLTGLAVGTAAALATPYIRPASAAVTSLRALMWEGYVLPDVVAAFEEEHQVKFAPSFFDGNSEAYNKLKLGGTRISTSSRRTVSGRASISVRA